MNARRAWQAAKNQLEMELPQGAFDFWISECEILSIEHNVFLIGAPSEHSRKLLENRLGGRINKLLSGILNLDVTAEYVVKG